MGKRGRPRKAPSLRETTIKYKGAKGEPSALTIYLKEIAKIGILSREEEQKFARELRDCGDSNGCREKLIVSNLKFVVSIAVKYQYFGMPLNDVIQEGNIGLMKAVEKFDPSRGWKLITYARFWIRQSIRRAIFESAGDIRFPARWEKIMREESDIGEWARNLYHCRSLEDQISEEGMVLGDILEDRSDPTMHQILDQIIIRESISRVIADKLTPKQAYTITRLYGLNGDMPQTLRQIAADWGCSYQSIEQTQRAAEAKLRNALGEERLKADFKQKVSTRTQRQLAGSLY
jgi:RNA polymerase primary sigma factor